MQSGNSKKIHGKLRFKYKPFLKPYILMQSRYAKRSQERR